MQPSAIASAGLSAASGLALLFASVHARAQGVQDLPPEFRNLGVDEHLGQPIPLDGEFTDQHGHPVHLRQYFDGHRPVVLSLVYYRCPSLCNLVLHSLVEGLRRMVWTLGDQYEAVSISIDAREGPADATMRGMSVLSEYHREITGDGWHFLTGNAAYVQQLADAVGFHYRFVPREQQIIHPAVIFLLTPDGRIARYLYGIEFRPNDLRLGLLEASEGRSITTVERLLRFCYHYDPQGRRYVLVAIRVMQLGGVVTIVLLGGLLAILWSREHTRRGQAQGPRT